MDPYNAYIAEVVVPFVARLEDVHGEDRVKEDEADDEDEYLEEVRDHEDVQGPDLARVAVEEDEEEHPQERPRPPLLVLVVVAEPDGHKDFHGVDEHRGDLHPQELLRRDGRASPPGPVGQTGASAPKIVARHPSAAPAAAVQEVDPETHAHGHRADELDVEDDPFAPGLRA